MISLLPSTTPSDTNGALAVLALLSDPKAAQKRLAELTEAAQRHDAALKALIEAQAALAKETKEIEARKAELAARELAIAQRESRITAKEKNWESTRQSILADVAAAESVA